LNALTSPLAITQDEEKETKPSASSTHTTYKDGQTLLSHRRHHTKIQSEREKSPRKSTPDTIMFDKVKENTIDGLKFFITHRVRPPVHRLFKRLTVSFYSPFRPGDIVWKWS